MQLNRRFYYLALGFTICIPLLVSAILLFVGQLRIQEFRNNHQRVADNTIKLVAEDISHLVSERYRLVQLFAEDEISLIRELALAPENEDLYAKLQKRIKRIFPNSYAFTIADHNGTPLLVDFDGYVGAICVKDIKQYSEHGHTNVRIHPNQFIYHFDVMGKWGNQEFGGIFFISFKPDDIARILRAVSPIHHELMLVDKEFSYLIEIVERGGRDKLQRNDYRMQPSEKNRILSEIAVAGTQWELVELHDPEVFSNNRQQIYLSHGIAIFGFLIIAIIGSIVLINMEKKRLQAEQTKEEMFSLFSHDLRSPLISIRGAVELLQAQLNTKIDAQGKRLLELTHDNTLNMQRIVDDILDIQKLEAGQMDFDMQLINLNTLLPHAEKINSTYASQFNVHLRTELPEQDINVLADKQRLLQALTNIISNAIKYSPADSTVTLALAEKSHMALLSVTDHGPGIPEEFQDKLFEKFTQCKQKNTNDVKGTGLGLAIVKLIVQAHAGTIYFNSIPGSGTQFFIELPKITASSQN